MALDPVVNFFRSTIATLPLNSGTTTMVLASGDGNKLPNPSVDGAFNLVVYNPSDPFVAPEIVRCTARTSDTLTISRGQEGTSDATKAAGIAWTVELVPTAKTIQDIDSKKVEKTGDTMTGTLTATKLIPSGNVTAGNGMYLPAANTVAFSTNGAERVRVNADGNMGIGTNNPTRRLTIAGQGAFLATTGASINLNNTTTGRGALIDFDNDNFLNLWPSAATSGHRFFTGDGTGTERLRITSAGDVGIGNTAPASKLHVTGLTRSTSGINFNASGGSTLSSYEEGTWTPTIVYSISDGNLSYVGRGARYTRIGRVVHVHGVITFTESTASGNVSIGALPFQATTTVAYSVGSFWVSNFTGISGQVQALIGNDVPANEVALSYGSTGTRVNITESNTGNNSTIAFSITYTV
jgi:hypothetical protein